MKRLLVVLGAGLILAGCGSGLVKVPLNNPLGLQGKSSTVTLAGSQQSLGAQATAQATLSLPTNTTFDDVSFDLPLSPSALTASLQISNVTFGTGCPATQPNPINVTISNLNVSVSDTFNSAARTASASAQSLTFTIGAGGSVSNLAGNSVTVSNLSNFVNIIRLNGTNTPNTLTMSGTISTDSTPGLAGCTITLNWAGGSGELAF